MFTDLTQSGSRNPLEGGLGFLDAQHQEWDCSDLHNGHSELGSMLSDTRQCPCSSFFDAWVELFQANHKGLKSTRINHGLG